MAASASNCLLNPYSTPETLDASITLSGRRVTAKAARAQRILGHAIEYLTDEFVKDGQSHSANHDLLEAVKLLMALNRQAYHDCSEVPTFGERMRAMLRLA